MRFFPVPPILGRDPTSDPEAVTKHYADAHDQIRASPDYDNTTAPTSGQAILWVPDGQGSGKFAPRTVTPAAIGAEAVANKSLPGAYVPNGYAGVDGNGNVPPGLLVGASASAYGIVRLAGGDLSGTSGAVTVPGKGLWSGLLEGGQYGDLLESFPRLLAGGTSAIGIGVIMAVGMQVPYAGAGAHLRLITGGTTPSGSGNFLAGIYSGTSVTALTQRATASSTALAANTYYELALSTTVSWNAADWVYAFFLFTGYTTPPSLRVIGGSGIPSGAVNSGTRLAITSSTSNNTALPTSPVNINSGYSGSGLPQFWALAA